MTAAQQLKPYSIEFTIGGLPSISANGSHGNPYEKNAERKKWHALVAYSIGWRTPPKPLQRAKLTLIRHSSTEPDFDGLVISFKAIIDGLVRAKVIVNDKRVNIGQPTYDWQYAPPKKGFITVRVEGA